VFADGPEAQLARSGVVLLDASASPVQELLRVSGATLGAPPSYNTMAFFDDERLLVPLYGDLDTGRRDRLVEVALASGAVKTVHEASGAFVLGDALCLAPCAARCFLSDAEHQGVRRLRREASGWTSEVIPVAPELGLPPRNLGAF
jgi:hypothetical protein